MTPKQNVMLESASEPIMNQEDQTPRRIYPKRKENWRLNILSIPRIQNQKYVKPPDVIDTGVRPEALKAPLKPRDVQMAIPPLRLLYVNKRTYEHNPCVRKQYVHIMDKQIEKAWHNIYNEYKKARREKHLQWLAKHKGKHRGRGKGGKGKEKGGKGAKGGKGGKGDKKGGKKDDTASLTSEEMEKHIQEWVEKVSKPKPIHEPEPIDRGPRCKLEDIKERLDVIGAPTTITEKYKPQPPPKHIVKESALTYEPSDRVIELAQPAAFRLVKEEEVILGSVKKSALLHKTTEKDNKLAVPRARAGSNDADLKEDPFTISKNALKYKATPRIIELAKPQERK